MNRKRIFALLRTIIVTGATAFLLLLSLNYYLRRPPFPELQFISNDGWDFDKGCRTLKNGKDQNELHCILRLRSDSAFTNFGNNDRIVQWCNQEVLNKMKSGWDIDWHFVRFNYEHSVPMWSDGCAEKVMIETDIYLQVIFE